MRLAESQDHAVEASRSISSSPGFLNESLGGRIPDRLQDQLDPCYWGPTEKARLPDQEPQNLVVNKNFAACEEWRVKTDLRGQYV